MRYCDLHCDLLSKIEKIDDWTNDSFKFHITPDSLSAGVFLQTFAVFAPNEEATMSAFFKKRTLFERLRKKLQNSGMVSVLSVENGAFLQGNIDNIPLLEEGGVRFLTLVWNGGNDLGAAHDCKNGADGGLTSFGKEVCERLFAGGKKIIPDVSHLSDRGIEEVSAIAGEYRASFVATHSGARRICGHSRNLADGQIRAVADSGGVVGVPFYLPFLRPFSPAEHAAYLLNVGGEDVVAVGSDFDGIDQSYYKDPSDAAARLADELKSIGFSERQVEKALQKNALRLLNG